MSNSNTSNMNNPENPRVTNNYKKADRKPTKPGSITSGFWGSCFPFSIAAFGTMLVDLLDIITDWLAYESLKQANISSYIPHTNNSAASASSSSSASTASTSSSLSSSSINVETFYANLPTALFAVCVVAACVFGLHIAWYAYMCHRRRRRFLEKRDGVPYSMSFVEEYGGELLTLMQCLAQDLPMSLLYLLLQVSICCDLLFTMPNLIYLVSFVATTLAAAVKVVQVVWRAGCFGQRYAYHKSRSLHVLRAGSLVVIVAALVTSSLNLALLTLHQLPRSFLQNDVFDKVGIKNWILDDTILLYHRHVRLEHPHDDGYNNTSVVALKDIMERESEVVTVILPCCVDEAHLDFAAAAVADREDDSGGGGGNSEIVNCSLVYQFEYRASELTIFYNYGYKCFDTSGSCVSHFRTATTTISSDDENQQTHSPPQGSISLQDKPDQRRIDSGSVVEMSPRYDAHWVKCSNIQLVRNETLLEFNPCSFSPLDQ